MHCSNFDFRTGPTKLFATGHVINSFQLTVRRPDKNTRNGENGHFCSKILSGYTRKTYNGYAIEVFLSCWPEQYINAELQNFDNGSKTLGKQRNF